MPHLTVLYTRSWGIPAWLIRNADRWGQWSHCALLAGDSVIESVWPGGVRATPILQFLKSHSRVEFVNVECERPELGLAWAYDQIGSPYDWKAIAGNLCRNAWEDPGAWTCAELVEAALVRAGRRRFRPSAWRISPNQSFMVT